MPKNEARQLFLETLMLDEPILLQSIIEIIESYEDKYAGSFEETLGSRNKVDLSVDELRDFTDWQYLISLFPHPDE